MLLATPLLIVALAPIQHQQASTNGSTAFKPPVRVEADGDPLGAKRLYPSPVFHDLNADGLLDIVIGDLPGKVTVAYRSAEKGASKWAPDVTIKNADGKDLKFSNW